VRALGDGGLVRLALRIAQSRVFTPALGFFSSPESELYALARPSLLTGKIAGKADVWRQRGLELSEPPNAGSRREPAAPTRPAMASGPGKNRPSIFCQLTPGMKAGWR